jgi:outer membrane protein TolC
MKMGMKKAVVFFLFAWGCASAVSAQWTLDECRTKARENYPLIRKYGLIERAEAYDLSNVSKAWLPQLQLNMRAGYQSEVTKIPIDLSSLGALGVAVPKMPTVAKDQYQATLEAGQTLWDGGASAAQRQQVKASAEVERTQWEVEM